MSRIAILKAIDRWIGSFAVYCLQHSPSIDRSGAIPTSILIIRPGGIGDAVHLLPCIMQLKTRFPDVNIDILAEQRNASIFGMTDQVQTIYCYDKPAELITCMRNRYDIVIDTEQWHRLSAVVASLIRTDLRIGFGSNERKKLFHYAVPYSHDEHEVSSFLHLIEPMTDKVSFTLYKTPFITIPQAVLEKAQSRYASIVQEPVIAIAPGASIAERRWGGDRFGQVARELASRGYSIIILGTDEDKSDATCIQTCVPEAISLAGKTDLGTAAAVLSSCRLLICADSGLLHIAVALGIPTVSLFGPGREKKWGPRGKQHRIINKNLSCSPCTTFGTTPPCRKNTACMQQIMPDEVIKAALELLN